MAVDYLSAGNSPGDDEYENQYGRKNYQAVIDLRSSVFPQYELEGIVEKIFEKDEGDVWYSVLSLRCVFFAYRPAKHVIFQRVYTESVRTEGRDPRAVVASMSDAAKMISRRIQQDVNDAVTQYEEIRRAQEAGSH